jgi:hypothetical protein
MWFMVLQFKKIPCLSGFLVLEVLFLQQEFFLGGEAR